MGGSYSIDDSGFRSRMSKLVATAKRPEGLMAAVGREGANRLKAHFRQRHASSPNKLGAPRSKYWLQMMRSVQSPKVNDAAGEVTITISDQRFNQKVYGGTITAKRSGALTIPIIAEAYNRRASVFEHEENVTLFRWHSQDGKLYLAYSKAERMQLAYLLTKSVDQAPDPDALPDEHALADALIDRADSVIRHQMDKI